MAEITKIAWCTSTFNPWIGCTKVGPGCDHCYAEMTDKFRWGGIHWGPGAPRRITSADYWRQPYRWNKAAALQGEPWRVFCASLADVFDNEMDQSVREQLFKVIRETPHLSWLLLTKRIGNVASMLPADWGDAGYANVQLGITVVNQQEADRDIRKLRDTPARVRWLSMEPLLEQVTILEHLALIDWVVVGGESRQGGKARAFDASWAEWLLSECQLTNTPFFFKQLGHAARYNGQPLVYAGKGDEPSEWPEQIRVREFPC